LRFSCVSVDLLYPRALVFQIKAAVSQTSARIVNTPALLHVTGTNEHGFLNPGQACSSMVAQKGDDLLVEDIVLS
jgi:hypothetical protein